MNDYLKGSFILIAVVALGFKAFDSFDDHTYALSDALAKRSPQTMSDDQMDALLAGADPTDLFEPTAAGKKIEILCDYGVITGDMDANRFSKISYASLHEAGMTYIQVSRFSPTFLTQDAYQTVSATEVTSVPSEIGLKLSGFMEDPKDCFKTNLYLSSIKYLK